MLKLLKNNRYLVREFLHRDLRSRYLGSLLGGLWSVLNPLFQLGLYTLVFSVFLNQRFDGVEGSGRFALFLFCALLPWLAVQESVSRGAAAFLDSSHLIRKMRFPLEVPPFTVALAAVVHQLIGTAAFAVVLFFAGELRWTTLLVLLPMAAQFIMCYGLALAAACLNVYVRDIAQGIGVVLLFLFWATPIVYPRQVVPEPFRDLLALNPLTHLVESYRFLMLGSPSQSVWGVLYWVVFSLVALLAGSWLLRRTREEIVDLV